jgi:hypothetical protein
MHHDRAIAAPRLLGLETVGYGHLMGPKYAPRAIVTIDVGNRAGHRIPDG